MQPDDLFPRSSAAFSRAQERGFGRGRGSGSGEIGDRGDRGDIGDCGNSALTSGVPTVPPSGGGRYFTYPDDAADRTSVMPTTRLRWAARCREASLAVAIVGAGTMMVCGDSKPSALLLLLSPFAGMSLILLGAAVLIERKSH
jgi:hypothetical protein